MRNAIRRGVWLSATAVLLLVAALPGLAQKEKKAEKRPPEDRPRFEKVTPVGELLEHTRWVRGTAFTADSKLLITASADHQLRAWDVATGKPHGEPMIAPHSINCLALSPGGTLALVGCGDYENAHGEAQVWDVD